MSGKKIFTVFGATGNQGGAIVDIFLNDAKLNKEWSVRGITRDVTKDSAKKLASQGVEVVGADLSDAASLEKAMQNSYGVFAVTNYWDKMDGELEIQQGKNLADAAKAAGVQHFIWSSLIDVNKVTNGKLPHVYHFDGKAKVEEYVRSLGIPATFFMPGMYMSNFPGGMLRQPEGPSSPWTLAMPVPSDTAQVPVFDTADTGKFVKAIVLHRDAALGRNVRGATRYMTPREMLDDFKAVFPEAGRTATYFEVPHDVFRKGIEARGMTPEVAQEFLENMTLLVDGGYYGGASLDDSHALLEDELTTWAAFLKKSPAFKDLK